MNLVDSRSGRTAATGAASPADAPLEAAWQVLRLSLGIGMILAGADKFLDRLATWSMYVSPLAERLLPVGSETFLRAAGIAEVALGVALFTRFARVAAYALAAWLLAIAANLAAAGTFWDLVLRDVELAAAAFALGRIGAWREARVRTTGQDVTRGAAATGPAAH